MEKILIRFLAFSVTFLLYPLPLQFRTRHRKCNGYILPGYAAGSTAENSQLNNEKNTMQLLTIEMPDHAVLSKPAQTVVFPLS